ncbi:MULTISPECIES: hypothetical protein [Burkholderia cepacia complex]|uniref:hypothetical protein n=1 Tax=Burkholderia cepacia complex TaxID=87882 RepID=UPI000ACB641A|nr:MULTISPECIES: hypothetical protein [Burkholderia cepacia complex]
MEPVPSNITKSYLPRGPLQQFRFEDATAFRCFRCGATKKSKLITVYAGDWSRKLCNGCYGRLLSLYEIKAGAAGDDERVEQLAEALLSLVTLEEQRQSEHLVRASDSRAAILSPEALRFVATAEYVASHLDSSPQLEWSPAVIGLCKAVEIEIVQRIARPLADVAGAENLTDDKQDKDIGRIAAFCAAPQRKPPELGTFSHFLQTVIHSQERRLASPLIRSFLRLTGQWVGSSWLLDPDGLHRTLTQLTKSYRNRAAHIDEMTRDDYLGCRETVIGTSGLVWKLIVSTERHK